VGAGAAHRSPIADGRAFGKMLTTFEQRSGSNAGCGKKDFRRALMDRSGKFSPERRMSNEPALRSIVRATIVRPPRGSGKRLLTDQASRRALAYLRKRPIFKPVRAEALAIKVEGTTINRHTGRPDQGF